MYYVYIAECSDGTYYTGYTTDVARRIKEHNQGIGAKYTRGRLPVLPVYSEEYETKSQAMKREYEIKQLSREEKKKMVNN